MERNHGGIDGDGAQPEVTSQKEREDEVGPSEAADRRVSLEPLRTAPTYCILGDMNGNAPLPTRPPNECCEWWDDRAD